MTRTLPAFLSDEYNRFRSLAINEWNVDEGYLASIEHLLKPIHKRYLSLACAATIAGYRAQRNEYAEGIVEVGNLCLVLTLKGLENPSCVLLRQSIELVLKHIFFSSHPTEYQWAQSRVDYKDLTFQGLVEYIGRTDEYRSLGDSHDICNKIGEWYGVLSRYVHVHSRGFMRYSRSGTGYRPTEAHIKKLEERTKGVWPCLIVLLTIFHIERFRKASLIEQRLIKQGLPKQYKSLF
jgi:hypothetical protein